MVESLKPFEVPSSIQGLKGANALWYSSNFLKKNQDSRFAIQT